MQLTIASAQRLFGTKSLTNQNGFVSFHGDGLSLFTDNKKLVIEAHKTHRNLVIVSIWLKPQPHLVNIPYPFRNNGCPCLIGGILVQPWKSLTVITKGISLK